MKEDNRSRGSTQQMLKLNIDNPLHCPHDLTKQQEFRDDLPTLLGNFAKNELQDKIKKFVSNLEKSKPLLSVFDFSENSNYETEKIKKTRMKFLGPYDRYKLVKPFLQAEEEKAAKQKEKDNERQPVDPSDEDRIAAVIICDVKIELFFKTKK